MRFSARTGSSAWSNEWRDSINDLARQVSNLRPRISSQINLNVIFQVPGKLLSPDFIGVRTESFSKVRNQLIVQVALPAEPPDEIGPFLRT